MGVTLPVLGCPMHDRSRLRAEADTTSREKGVAALDIAYHEGKVIMATWHNMSIVAWGEVVTVPMVREFFKMSEKLVQGCESRVSSVHMILNDIPIPTGEVRTDLAKLTEHFSRDLACVATVLTGSGFTASAMRGFLTGLQWVQKRTFTPRIFSKVREAVEWLPPLHTQATGVPISAAELEHVLTVLEARVARR